jgi:hypothetical protein
LVLVNISQSSASSVRLEPSVSHERTMAKHKPREKLSNPEQFSEAIAAAQKQLDATEDRPTPSDLPAPLQPSLLAEIVEQEEPSHAAPGVSSGTSGAVSQKLSPLERAERRLRAVQKERQKTERASFNSPDAKRQMLDFIAEREQKYLAELEQLRAAEAPPSDEAG